jgi:hypothetical protein
MEGRLVKEREMKCQSKAWHLRSIRPAGQDIGPEMASLFRRHGTYLVIRNARISSRECFGRLVTLHVAL